MCLVVFQPQPWEPLGPSTERPVDTGDETTPTETPVSPFRPRACIVHHPFTLGSPDLITI